MESRIFPSGGLRRTAASPASAPYKHFKNKNDYILAILHYINEQWHQVERADPGGRAALSSERWCGSVSPISVPSGQSPLPGHYHAAG